MIQKNTEKNTKETLQEKKIKEDLKKNLKTLLKRFWNKKNFLDKVKKEEDQEKIWVIKEKRTIIKKKYGER